MELLRPFTFSASPCRCWHRFTNTRAATAVAGIDDAGSVQAGQMHASGGVNPFPLYKGNEKEEFMRITSLVIVLVAATALAVLGQEGTIEEAKHGAKKAGETIKNGLETVGEKTKDAAETVGEKTKETAETVGKKTKETVETAGQKTKESAKAAGRKSKKSSRKAKPQATDERSTNREPNIPSPNDR